MSKDKELTGLELLRKPFEPHQISKLPKPTKAQTDAVKADFKQGIRCKICGGWHHPDVIHLDYVGHAALTDRLLDCDPNWSWEPVSFDANGSPFLDNKGGLWIKLTVCNVSRYGYGHPDGKQGGDAVKESIGDALRNAAMRFGAALDLWHKGDLHAIAEDDDGNKETESAKPKAQPKAPISPEVEKSWERVRANEIAVAIDKHKDLQALEKMWEMNAKDLDKINAASEKAHSALLAKYNAKRVELENKEMDGGHE